MPPTAPATGPTSSSTPPTCTSVAAMTGARDNRGTPIWLLVLGLVAAAANLRVAVASVPPLVDTISRDLGLSGIALGALTGLPVLCMGVFAPSAGRLAHRIGAPHAILVALGCVGVGEAARLAGGSVPVLYAATTLAGLGIAIGNTLLPGLVKSLLPPERAGAGTSLYFIAMMAGAAAAASLSVPLVDRLGSWQASLASWAVLAAFGALAWWALVRALPRHPTATPAPPAPAAATSTASPAAGRLPWRHPTARLLAAYLVMQSSQFFTSLAWLAPSYVGDGWSRADAGLLLTAFTGGQAVGGLAGPVLADRVEDRRALLLAATAVTLVGFAGLAAAPAAAPWLWSVVLGAGQGAAFGIGLTLLVTYAASAAASARLSGMCFLLAYGTAAFVPSAYGALRDVTGSLRLGWALFAGLMIVQAVVVSRLRPDLERTP